MPLIAFAGVSNKAIGLDFSLSFYLHTCFDNTSSEGSGESAYMLLADVIITGIWCTGSI